MQQLEKVPEPDEVNVWPATSTYVNGQTTVLTEKARIPMWIPITLKRNCISRKQTNALENVLSCLQVWPDGI